MILKNFKTLMKLRFTNNTVVSANIESYPSVSKTFVCVDGNTKIITSRDSPSNWFTSLNPSSPMQNETDSIKEGLHMLLGTGTVSDVNKYSLDDKICDLKVTSTVFKTDTEAVFYLTSTFKNETENTIIVNEVAVYYYHSILSKPVMIIHEVLPEPITIMPNTEETINVTIY